MLWKSKKVLVTGGAGFIGSNLAIKLLELGAEVEVVDMFSPYCGANPQNLSTIEKRIRIHRLDMAFDPLDTPVRGQEYIFHLAGQIGHQFSHQKPETDLNMNTVSTLRLLETVSKTNPTARLVYTGTRQIFGEPQYLPVDEKHPICPIDINGIHKNAAEEYFRMYHKVKDLKTTVLRLTNTYGPRQPIRSNQLGVVGWFINRVLNDAELTLALGGTQQRDFTYVDDVVEACLTSALNKETIGKTYNLSGYKTSLKGLAELLIQIGKGGRLGDLSQTEEEKKIQLQDYYGSSEKLKSDTGWEPRTNLEDGLRQTMAYYQEHKSQYLSANASGTASGGQG